MDNYLKYVNVSFLFILTVMSVWARVEKERSKWRHRKWNNRKDEDS